MPGKAPIHRDVRNVGIRRENGLRRVRPFPVAIRGCASFGEIPVVDILNRAGAVIDFNEDGEP